MKNFDRRTFLKGTFWTTCAAFTGVIFQSGQAFAARCATTMAQAKNLKYVEDFKEALKKKVHTEKEINMKERANPRKLKKEQMTCENCSLYGVTGPEACVLIPGCTVTKNGWCTGWAGKP